MSARESWEAEKESAWLYRVLAETEPVEAHRALFARLGEEAESQARIWEKDVAPLGAFTPSLRARLVAQMEAQGYNKTVIELSKMAARALDPRLILGIASYLPLLNKMRDNVIKMGLPEEKLYAAMKKFEKIAGRTAEGRRNPWYQIIAWNGRMVVNRKNRIYHTPVDAMVRATDMLPQTSMPEMPSWVKELTYEPVAIH